MNHAHRITRGGFSLIEMVIYASFLAVFSVVAVQALFVVTRSFYTLRTTQSLTTSAVGVLERMSREIRNAYDIDVVNSALDVNPGRLTLRTKDSSGNETTVEFYIQGSRVFIKENGVDKGSLMTASATVQSLVFRSVTTANSKAVKIELSLHDEAHNLGQTSVFYDTIGLRGSVQ